MRVKRTWFLLFLMVCVVFGLQSGTVSAAGEQITVNGRNILQEPGHMVSCGNGTAAYDPNTKTLTLTNVAIDKDSNGKSLLRGIEVWGEEITVELIGDNEIHAHLGIESNNPLKIKGVSGGSLTFYINQDSELFANKLSARGIIIEGGGLTVEDANLNFVFEEIGSASSYGIDICGKDNRISNSQIKITNPSGLVGLELQRRGINAAGADSLVINQSSIIMEKIDIGIGAGGGIEKREGKVVVSDSELSITADECAITCEKLEILDKAEVNVSAEKGVALGGNKNITVSGSSVSANSKGSNGLICDKLEIKDSSTVTANGYWPGLYAVSSTVIENSTVEAGATNDVGMYSEGTITLEESEVTAADSILANGAISITGGKTEIGSGKISSKQDVYIGGIVTSNGTPSYENIESGTSGKKEFADADYSAVDVAIAKAEALKKEDFANFEIVEDALKAVVRGKDIREQDVVDGYAAAIEAAMKALTPVPDVPDVPDEYKIIEGADQTIIIGKDKGVTIKADGNFDKFINVLMDGKEIAKKNYTAVSGSTIITLKPEYINTLSAGVHTVTINYTDGMTETKLTLKKEENQPTDETQKPSPNQPTDETQKPSSNETTEQTRKDGTAPKTGDWLPVGWIAAFAASAMAILSVGRYRRKML